MTTDNTKKGFTGTGRPRDRVYVKTWICMIMVLATLILFSATNAVGEPQSDQSQEAKTLPVTDASAGVGELINILVDKGLLKKEDIALLSEQKEAPSLAVLTELLKSKGILTATEAEKIAKKAETGKAVTLYYEQNPAEAEKITRKVTSELKKDFKDQMKTEIKEEILQETKKEIQSAAAPEWTKRIRFGGDIRLRYQGDYFGRSNDVVQLNPNDLTQTLNLTEDRHRLRGIGRASAPKRTSTKRPKPVSELPQGIRRTL
jgi:ABC-type Na+ efflux pump permease subunit